MNAYRGNINIFDTIINAMDEETRIRMTKTTLMELRKHKAIGEFISYDDLVKYWMKVCPITGPVREEVE